MKKAYENLTPDWLKKWLPKNKDLDKITNKDKYNNLLEDVTKGNTSKFIATFRELFEELVDDMGYKAVVVYIDDLDRCEPKKNYWLPGGRQVVCKCKEKPHLSLVQMNVLLNMLLVSIILFK
ncbi:MAG: hypothetical protein L6V92_12680 [Phocaeicola vulgatus]|nr:MAG: hypothetical protein L6V92_12680 [Phocaeicola vulgatus]